jgi:hypothetical protein
MKFTGRGVDGEFLLAQVDSGAMNLISLKNGNRWNNVPLKAANSQKISSKLFHAHFAPLTPNTPKDRWSWKLVDKQADSVLY